MATTEPTIPPSAYCDSCGGYVDLALGGHEHDARLVTVIVTIEPPDRSYTERLVHSCNTDQWDEEWRLPLTYALNATEEPGPIRSALIRMDGDDDFRGDWRVTVWSDGSWLYDGSAWDCLDSLRLMGDRQEAAR